MDIGYITEASVLSVISNFIVTSRPNYSPSRLKHKPLMFIVLDLSEARARPSLSEYRPYASRLGMIQRHETHSHTDGRLSKRQESGIDSVYI